MTDSTDMDGGDGTNGDPAGAEEATEESLDSAGLDESAAVDALGRLGLSQYEAEVFIALQTLGTGTARDVDRMADVPRSQVYGAAESLEDRGLVEVQQSNPIQYRAVGLDEARDILHERFEREQERAFEYLERARAATADRPGERQEGVWTLSGRENVSGRVQQIVADADERVVYGTCEALRDDDVAAALRARAADVDVHVFSDDASVREAYGDAAGVTVSAFDDQLSDDVAGRLLAVDGDTVLISVLGGEDAPGERDETAIWSAETGFAVVFLRLLGSHLGENVETTL